MKHILALLFVISAVHSLKAQQYQPFDLDSGRWYAVYSSKGGMFGGGTPVNVYARDSVKFYCEGDTIIDAMTYKKLMYVGNTQSEVVPLSPISGYYGALRNDVPNKKVYLLPRGATGTEALLYDFNLNIGDSIGPFISTEYPEPISQIDSVLYCGVYHKRYKTASGYYEIEGVGSKYGLISVKWATNYGWLLCYQEFGNGACADCNIPLSLDSYSQSQFTVFPNPTTGKFQINSDLDIRSVEVYDVRGKLVERFDHYDGAIELPNTGYYLLKISTDSDVFVQKLIRE